MTRDMMPTPMGSSREGRGGSPMDASEHSRQRTDRILTPTAKGNMDAPSMAKWQGGWDFLPTPTKRDTRSDQASAETLAKNSRPLSERSGELGLTGTAEKPVSQRRALLLGLVLWMMGQDPSWLRACETAPLPRSEMRSSRRSRRRSAARYLTSWVMSDFSDKLMLSDRLMEGL